MFEFLEYILMKKPKSIYEFPDCSYCHLLAANELLFRLISLRYIEVFFNLKHFATYDVLSSTV